MAFNEPNRSPWEKKNSPPNIEDFLNMLRNRLKDKFHWGNWWLIALILIAVWGLSGVFVVDPQEQAAIKTFGRLTRIVGPGPNYHLPFPIEAVLKERVTEVKRVEVGYRTINQTPPFQYRDIKAESLMLTGDESIVDIQFTVQYRISDLTDYLFNVQEVPVTIRAAAESTMREVIGKSEIDAALTTGKAAVETETRALLASIMDKYDSGVTIVNIKLQDVQPPPQVSEAFKAVASAREEKERLVREAEGYRNDLLPRAQGEAEQIVNQARAYFAERTNVAAGEANRFESVLTEYRKAKQVFRDRIRIETMEFVLPNVTKVIVSKSIADNVLPFMSLNRVPELVDRDTK